ncbi:MAG: hypothetical protein ACRDO7_08290 [Nocardioidaceae bacterium]
MSEKQQRLKAQLTLSSMMCLLLFVSIGMWLGAAGASFESSLVLVALWWGSLFLGAACGIAACRIDDDTTEDAHYLGSLVTGIRHEWQHPPRSATRGR